MHIIFHMKKNVRISIEKCMCHCTTTTTTTTTTAADKVILHLLITLFVVFQRDNVFVGERIYSASVQSKVGGRGWHLMLQLNNIKLYLY